MLINPDITSVKAVNNTLSKLIKLHFNIENIDYILNKASQKGGIEISSINEAVKKTVKFSLPYFEDAPNSINRGEPAVFAEPGSQFSKAVKLGAEELETGYSFKDISGSRKTETEPDKKGKEAALKKKVHELLVKTLSNINIDINSVSDLKKADALKTTVKETVEKIFSEQAAEIENIEDRKRLIAEVISESLGYGPLEDLLNDSEISEIMVNSKDMVYAEKKGKLYLTDKQFLSDKQILAVIERIVAPIGRRIDESNPLVDARLSDGSRVNAIIPPLALKGPCLTIRKFSKERLKADDLIRFGSLTREAAEFIKTCVKMRKNIVISGGTGSGKTTLLNIVSSFIPDDERIVTIEDSAELNLSQEHVVTLESRPPNIEGKGAITIRDLVKNALRMRPDRIIVGECRSGETLDMLQAMNTGHDGSLTTLHSNSPRDTLSRLETMVLMAGMDLPLKAIREQVSSAVDIIIHQSRFKDGSRRVTHITEVTGMESEIISTQDIFLLKEPAGIADAIIGSLKPTGIIPVFMEDADTAIDRSIFMG
jgi:pilus assembly protein CpaF